MKSWKLTDPRWHAVVQVIEVLEAAWAGRDVEAFRAAPTELELASPTRITRIGAEPAVPPPPPVLKIANSLVHSLVGAGVERSGYSVNRSDE